VCGGPGVARGVKNYNLKPIEKLMHMVWRKIGNRFSHTLPWLKNIATKTFKIWIIDQNIISRAEQETATYVLKDKINTSLRDRKAILVIFDH
jgi:hypothetical protein